MEKLKNNLKIAVSLLPEGLIKDKNVQKYAK